jgi:glycosyltransferase involved in cell wall biosynthesis
MSNKISVVIPVYNGETFIGRAIQSALDQSEKPFEIVVVNDGSKDSTAEKLAAFGNAITVISIPNGGVSNARNLGIKACHGELIAFLDADDVWYTDKLKLQLDIFERYSEIGFCCCNYEFFSVKTNVVSSHFSQFENDAGLVFDNPLPDSLSSLVLRNIVGTCSNVMIRQQVLERVGLFNVNYKQSEDYDLWLRCALETRFYLMSAVLLEKKSHDSNLTNNFLETLLFHEQVLVNIRLNEAAKRQIETISDKYFTALALVRYEIGNLFYEYKQPVSAFKYFFLGMITSLTVNNFILFNKFFFRKLIRTVSFGLLRNKKG